MMQTNTQYMSDPARVERVTARFMALTIHELREARGRKMINFITDVIIPRECLSAESVQEMPYVEFACLIDNIRGRPEYDWPDHDSEIEQLIYYKCLAGVLLAGSKVSIPIRMFTALPLKAFYDYLYRISGQKALLTDFEYMRSCCKYQDGFTIRDFLNEKTNTINTPWLPMTPLEQYEENNLTAHEDIGRLLVNSFYMALPQRFCAEEICERYHDPYFDDSWDDICWDDFEYGADA